MLIIVKDKNEIEQFNILKDYKFLPIFTSSCDKSESILINTEVSAILIDIDILKNECHKLHNFLIKNYPNIPVIILTDFVNKTVTLKYIDYCAYDYVLKPIEMNGLVANLIRAVEEYELKEKLINLNSVLERSLELLNFRNQIIK
ncbi:MAG: response regulator [Spirochaetota bacterium]|nr:response regulator [Spirochaetota bacterium]